jgi:hypothetical protein
MVCRLVPEKNKNLRIGTKPAASPSQQDKGIYASKYAIDSKMEDASLDLRHHLWSRGGRLVQGFGRPAIICLFGLLKSPARVPPPFYAPGKSVNPMKATLFNKMAAIPAFCAAVTASAQIVISPPNYTVTTPNKEFEYVVNGQSSGQPATNGNVNDSLNFSLNAGATYMVSMNTASIHPVDICTNPDTTSHYDGASAQAVSSGTVTLTIPATNYPPTLYYICDNHLFYGTITVSPPQPPPSAAILQTSVTTNILLTFSGGTNTIQVIPQFSSNFVNGIWLPVPGYTNTFSGNGTNTTSFDRLDAVCGPDVFLRISQAPN